VPLQVEDLNNPEGEFGAPTEVDGEPAVSATPPTADDAGSSHSTVGPDRLPDNWTLDSAYGPALDAETAPGAATAVPSRDALLPPTLDVPPAPAVQSGSDRPTVPAAVDEGRADEPTVSPPWPTEPLAPPAPPQAAAPDEQATAGAASASANERAAVGLDVALKALLTGAGIADAHLPSDATPELFRRIGELLALYTGGTANILHSIGEIKNTFRIEQTQIQQHDNNPLRWAVSRREAVKRLLAPEDDGYLAPAAAVVDALDGIRAHQIGTIRGLESAVKQLLVDQAPEELEREFERHGRPGPLTNRGAWCWQKYRLHHERLSERADDNLLELLGSAFYDAYEQQVRTIRRRG
jgi:type VI secretion system protein ImpI/type VI secretion system protein